METIENKKHYNFLGDDMSEDFDAKQNLTSQVVDRFENIRPELTGKHLYSLNITKLPTRTNYHQFSMERVQEISRKLTNGLTSLGTIPNRKFWNKYFLGGVRTISIQQEVQNEYPSFILNYLVYSEIDNLDVRIKNNLSTRIKMIDPFVTMSFNYLGKYSPELILENLQYPTDMDYTNENLLKLGEETINDIFNNQFQRPRFFGKLFKIRK